MVYFNIAQKAPDMFEEKLVDLEILQIFRFIKEKKKKIVMLIEICVKTSKVHHLKRRFTSRETKNYHFQKI